ncbi:hypothetical protein FFF34_003475 [Inquilinus sp. KBS0705]|nr:hypothetical protein FFF34_003475 [Inquilinus sp. KBS0705]
MKHKEVIILGSGQSINELSKQEIDYVNNCEGVIAMNKFMAFYKQTGIKPNIVYYVDNHHINTKRFLNYLFKVCRQNSLTGITFFLNKKIKSDLYTSVVAYLFAKIRYNLKTIARKILYDKKKTFIQRFFFLAPSKNNYTFVKCSTYLVGGEWAKSVDEVLFHYRGSLSTVLNLATVLYPGYTIKLLGNDFNNGAYFFDEALKNIDVEWKDHTSEKVKETNTHWSVAQVEGTTIFDKFPYILSKLKENNNEIYCCNKQSLLVTGNYIPYAPVITGSVKTS